MHITFPTATDVCLPIGMRLAAPHTLCMSDAHQRLLTRLRGHVGPCLCVRRAGSDLNPNHFLVFAALCTAKSFAVVSPTFRLALFAWHLTLSGCLETMRQREARGTGASAQIGVSCACWGVKVLPENHVDTPICATDSGHEG